MSEHLEFPELISWYQRQQGLTDAELARRSKLNKSTIGRLKRGDRHPSWPDTVNKLIQGLALEGGEAEDFKIAAARYLGFTPAEPKLPPVPVGPGGQQRVATMGHAGISDASNCDVCGANSKTVVGCATCGAPYCQHCMRTTRPFGARCFWCGFHAFGGD